MIMTNNDNDNEMRIYGNEKIYGNGMVMICNICNDMVIYVMIWYGNENI